MNLTRILADSTVDDNASWIGPGMLGFIIVVIIGIATWFLVRSMAKQLRKLDANRLEQEEDAPQDEAPARDPEPNGAH